MNLKKTHFMQIRKSFLSTGTHFWNIHLNHPDAEAVTRTNTYIFRGVTDEMHFGKNILINLLCFVTS